MFAGISAGRMRPQPDFSPYLPKPMGLRQHFRFTSTSQEAVLEVLRGFSEVVKLDERDGFVVFSQRYGAKFSFDCELVEDGIVSERAGEYFTFLGMFLEGLTGAFSPVTVEDV